MVVRGGKLSEDGIKMLRDTVATDKSSQVVGQRNNQLKLVDFLDDTKRAISFFNTLKTKGVTTLNTSKTLTLKWRAEKAMSRKFIPGRKRPSL